MRQHAATMTATDDVFMQRAVALAVESVARTPNGTPIGAVLVQDGRVIGEGASCVIDAFDPTAHAEIQALRVAGRCHRTHLFPGSVLYTSLAPCPLCLAACYWAEVSRVVYAAGYDDSARFGFPDREMFAEFTKPAERRLLPVCAAGTEWVSAALEPCFAWARKHGHTAPA